MTTTLKSNEALSSGHIFNKEEKSKQSETIQAQIDEFFAKKKKEEKKK